MADDPLDDPVARLLQLSASQLCKLLHRVCLQRPEVLPPLYETLVALKVPVAPLRHAVDDDSDDISDGDLLEACKLRGEMAGHFSHEARSTQRHSVCSCQSLPPVSAPAGADPPPSIATSTGAACSSQQSLSRSELRERTPPRRACASGGVSSTPPRVVKSVRPSVACQKRYVGIISWFSPEKHFGFIKSEQVMEEYRSDAFLLESQLKGFSVNSLVSFCVALKSGSPQAHDLRTASPYTLQTQPSGDIQGSIMTWASAHKTTFKRAIRVFLRPGSGAEALRFWHSILEGATTSIRIASFGLDSNMLHQTSQYSIGPKFAKSIFFNLPNQYFSIFWRIIE